MCWEIQKDKNIVRKEEKMNGMGAGKKGFHISSPDSEGSSENSSANMKGTSSQEGGYPAGAGQASTGGEHP